MRSASVSPGWKGAGQERPGAGMEAPGPRTHVRASGRLPARAQCRRSSSASRRASSGGRAGWSALQAHSWPGSPSSSALARASASPPRRDCLVQAAADAGGRGSSRSARGTWIGTAPPERGRPSWAPGLPLSSPTRADPDRAGPVPRRGRPAASVGTASAGGGRPSYLPSQAERFRLAKMVPKCPRAPLPSAALPRLPRIAGFPGQCPSRQFPDPACGRPRRGRRLWLATFTECSGPGAWSPGWGWGFRSCFCHRMHRGPGSLGGPGLV